MYRNYKKSLLGDTTAHPLIDTVLITSWSLTVDGIISKDRKYLSGSINGKSGKSSQEPLNNQFLTIQKLPSWLSKTHPWKQINTAEQSEKDKWILCMFRQAAMNDNKPGILRDANMQVHILGKLNPGDMSPVSDWWTEVMNGTKLMISCSLIINSLKLCMKAVSQWDVRMIPIWAGCDCK